MNRSITAFILSVFWVTIATLSTQAQGTFQNLNFESANPVSAGNPFDPTQVTFGSALPGWSGSIGGTSLTTADLNDFSLGAAQIDIFGPGWTESGPGIIDGNYTVYLQAFFPSEGNVSLLQDGTIPANAASIQFKAWEQVPAFTLLSASFAGNNLSLVLLSTGTAPSGQTYNVYGANIAPYAGEAGQLEFTSFGGNGISQIELDDIAFSTQAVPEPSPFVLTGVGALLFALYRRCAPNRP